MSKSRRNFTAEQKAGVDRRYAKDKVERRIRTCRGATGCTAQTSAATAHCVPEMFCYN